ATRITSVPNTFGATFPQENLNSNEIKGIELMVSHRNTVGKFDYNVSANVTYSRQYLLHVEQAPYRSTYEQWHSRSDGDGRIQGREWIYEEGEQYTSVVDFETAPLRGGANGNSYGLPGMYELIDLNEDGVIDRTDNLPNSWAGTYTNPPLQYGANLYASYRNFDFAIGLQGSALFTVWVSRYDNWGYGTRFPVVWTWYLDRWHMEDPDDDPFDPATKWIPGKWEALTANPFQNQTWAASHRWRMPATYLRLKTLEVGYTLPANISRKLYIEHLRPFINIFNVFTLCREDVKGLDPERNEGEYRVDLTYPLLRSFNFGVEIKF
ncbi:SusC/RagA family TonB-linked outer membrane protein, partial [Candidatus Dojkabacteria bacterium]|nr:SusC/RagA family TonB-linked outer membrane protein [Candidatus Dojkabacteria bacterium]